MLATDRRDEPIEAGRGEEVEKLVEAATKLQESLQAGAEMRARRGSNRKASCAP